MVLQIEDGNQKVQPFGHPIGIVGRAATHDTYESNASTTAALLLPGHVRCGISRVAITKLYVSPARRVCFLFSFLPPFRRGKDDAQGEDTDCLLCTTFGTSQGCVIS